MSYPGFVRCGLDSYAIPRPASTAARIWPWVTRGGVAERECKDLMETHRKVALPEHIAVGDKLSLPYGSNPKDYTFPVLGIRLQGNSCTLLNDATGAPASGEKIELAQCQKSPDIK